MRRTIFTYEHEQFRQMVRTFLEKECVPHTAEWLEAGVVSRAAWRKVGELRLLGWMVPRSTAAWASGTSVTAWSSPRRSPPLPEPAVHGA